MTKSRPIRVFLTALLFFLVLSSFLYLYLKNRNLKIEKNKDNEESVFEDVSPLNVITTAQDFREEIDDQLISLRLKNDESCSFSDYLFKVVGKVGNDGIWKINTGVEEAFIVDFFNFKPLSGSFEIGNTYYATFKNCFSSVLFTDVLNLSEGRVLDVDKVDEEAYFLLLSDFDGDKFGVFYYPHKISLLKYEQNKTLKKINIDDIKIGNAINYVADRAAQKYQAVFKGNSIPSYHNPLEVKFILVVNRN